MRRRLLLPGACLALLCLLAWPAASSTVTLPAPVHVAPLPKIQVQQDSAALIAAQAWLKSIGYDLTIDQVQNLTRLNLGLYSLETVNLITDENTIHLRVLKNLEEIDLHRQLGDATLANLADLVRLRVLAASDTKVTGAGLVHLKKLTELRTLLLHVCRINDADLALIAHLTQDRDPWPRHHAAHRRRLAAPCRAQEALSVPDTDHGQEHSDPSKVQKPGAAGHPGDRDHAGRRGGAAAGAAEVLGNVSVTADPVTRRTE